jgi:hypothetical protein
MGIDCRSIFVANDSLLAEMEKMGEVHTLLADRLENELHKSTQNYVKEKSKSRKKVSSLEDTNTHKHAHIGGGSPLSPNLQTVGS